MVTQLADIQQASTTGALKRTRAAFGLGLVEMRHSHSPEYLLAQSRAADLAFAGRWVELSPEPVAPIRPATRWDLLASALTLGVLIGWAL